jgi:hypothetical protein
MYNSRVSTKTFALLALLALLVSSFGCRMGDVTAPEPTPERLITDPDAIVILSTPKNPNALQTSSSASSFVSAANGGVVFNDFVMLEFPAGALLEDTEITINMPEDGKLIVEFGPHGITFNKPVVMTFDLSRTNANGMSDRTETLWFNEEGGWWEPIEKAKSDDKNKSNSILWHFSQYKGTLGG